MTKHEDRETALKSLEESSRWSPRREFLAMLVSALSSEDDVALVKPLSDKRGPLGGRSQQLHCVFTDSRGNRHGVVVNAYVGEPDITLTEDGEVRPNGR